MDIEETKLPGVGVRHDFVTKNGERVGVVTHRTGRRELLIYDRDDPDACRETVWLEEHESQVVGELLGAPAVVESVLEARHSLQGLAMDWVNLGPGAPGGGRTIGDTQLRSETGCSVIAIVRGDTTIPAPGPEDELREGDTVVVVGTAEGLEKAIRLLRG